MPKSKTMSLALIPHKSRKFQNLGVASKQIHNTDPRRQSWGIGESQPTQIFGVGYPWNIIIPD